MQSALAEHSQLHTHAVSLRLPRHVSDFRLRKHALKIQILHVLNMHQHFGIVRPLEVHKTQYGGVCVCVGGMNGVFIWKIQFILSYNFLFFWMS